LLLLLLPVLIPTLLLLLLRIQLIPVLLLLALSLLLLLLLRWTGVPRLCLHWLALLPIASAARSPGGRRCQAPQRSVGQQAAALLWGRLRALQAVLLLLLHMLLLLLLLLCLLLLCLLLLGWRLRLPAARGSLGDSLDGGQDSARWVRCS
jgi:hypothetical protein